MAGMMALEMYHQYLLPPRVESLAEYSSPKKWLEDLGSTLKVLNKSSTLWLQCALLKFPTRIVDRLQSTKGAEAMSRIDGSGGKPLINNRELAQRKLKPDDLLGMLLRLHEALSRNE